MHEHRAQLPWWTVENVCEKRTGGGRLVDSKILILLAVLNLSQSLYISSEFIQMEIRVKLTNALAVLKSSRGLLKSALAS